MSQLEVTLIDVGWGDSIFLKSVDSVGQSRYALIDSNDTTNFRSSEIFIKRYLQREGVPFGSGNPLVFDWSILTHVHADHAEGLKRLFSEFGTERFYYPKSKHNPNYFTDLLRYANRSTKVAHHQAIDDTKLDYAFGDANVEILWPPRDLLPDNENNNSIVLLLTLGPSSLILTGDAEAEVWDHISGLIPSNTVFFKAPHHGSQDAVFNSSGATPWLDRIPIGCKVAISSHISPHNLPSASTIAEFDSRGVDYTRTDFNYHISITLDGSGGVLVKHSRN